MTAGDKDDERDPFEDLDQFFAPIEDADEPEDLAPSTPEDPEPAEPEAEQEAEPGTPEVTHDEAADALEGLEVSIELPDESDLVPDVPDEPEPEPEPEAPEGAGSEESPIPDEPEHTSELEGEGDWDRVRAETLAGAGAEGSVPTSEEAPIPEVGPDLEGYPGLTTGDEPEVEVLAEDEAAAAAEFADLGEQPDEEPALDAVEAAAEHFASGMRETPDEIERELLSDLEEDSVPATVRIEPTGPPVETPAWQESEPPPVAEGPTWQEGGHPVVTEEVPPEAPAAAAGRNVPAALVSGVLLGAAVLALLAVSKGAFLVLATAAILLAQAELYAVMRTRALQPATLLGLVCGAFAFAGAYLQGEAAVLLGLALAMGLTVPWYIAAPANTRKHTTANVAVTILGVVYVPVLASFAMLLLRAEGDAGTYMFLAVLVLTVLYDVVAYAVGTVWGHRPLAPTVSPNKSWEGAFGGTLVILIVALGVIPNFTPFNGEGGAGIAVGLALVIAIMAPLGDLVESAFKRDLGVKDMGSLLPGHGGVLDRIDALLFAFPAAYFFLRIALF